MWFLNRRKREKELADKEKQIQAIHRDTLKKIDDASRSNAKVNNFIEKNGGITEMIFLATGGGRRKK